VYDVATGGRLDRVVWEPVRGLEGVKEASVTIPPHPEGPLHNSEPVTVNIAVANGLGERGRGPARSSGAGGRVGAWSGVPHGLFFLQPASRLACWMSAHLPLPAACLPASPLAGNAKKLLKGVQEGGKQYHFVEVMACPGGCIGGGGQPRSKDKEILQKRQAALYK
jgi:hypothetical protein